jgi:hypothetical protein
MTAHGPEEKCKRVEVASFAGLLIDAGKAINDFLSGYDLRRRNETARVAPPAPEGVEALRDGFLMRLVQVLAKIVTGAHVPGRHSVGTFGMEPAVELVRRISDLVPDTGENAAVLLVGGKVGIKVDVRTAARLELRHPEISEEGERLPGTRQEEVELTFVLLAVNRPVFVIGQTELRADQVGAVGSGEAQTSAGVIGKALNAGVCAVCKGRR